MNLKYGNKDVIDVALGKKPIRELFSLKNVLVTIPAVFDRSKIVYSTNFYIGYEGTESITVLFNVGSYNESLRQITFSSINFQANGRLSLGLPNGNISITVGNYSNAISGTFDINEGLGFWGLSGSFTNAIVTFNTTEWNNILVTPSGSYYEIQKRMHFENNAHHRWKYQGRVGYSITYLDPVIKEFEYQDDINVSLIESKIPPLKALKGEKIIKYLGHGPRNQFGLDGSAIQYIYDVWEVIETDIPEDPEYYYIWELRETIEVYASYPPYDFENTTIGKHYTETVLNGMLTPGLETLGTVARDLISVRQASPGVYLSTYDYWEIVRITY